ncbi:hypothetical protein HYP99_gp094 [Sinorhizobium phage ort11]|uniref:Uncharacterized protein n=1 Tax=Sinorhizobium phage ort11 TaxID=2599764 RepID=A0A5C2H917_9CAUD|nr:hypothetical protein HYP99_gp094 [Sinorhizobium phage ort11]QEP29899.1 hypothetical protein Smphiort11_101 [Sinorhizobium phage ort11]
MKILLDEATSYTYNYIPVTLVLCHVMLGKDKKVIREITLTEWDELRKNYPKEVEKDGLTIEPVMMIRKA